MLTRSKRLPNSADELRFAQPAHHVVFEDAIETIEAATARRDRLTVQIETLLPGWSLAPVVLALQALRGMALVNAATLIAELGDLTRFADARQIMAFLGLVPSKNSSGGAVSRGGITKTGNTAARRELVEATWAAAKTPGPLHAFFVRIRARRGHQIAAVAVARKLAVLCWHLLTRQTDYHWARPALVANKRRAMELQAGRPQKKGNKRGPTYAYNVKALRDQEMRLAQQAEHSYEHLVAHWQARPAKKQARGRLKPAGLK